MNHALRQHGGPRRPEATWARATSTRRRLRSLRVRSWSATADRRHRPPGHDQHVLDVFPTAEASWYDGVGHVPFLEPPERFDDELGALTRRSRG